jgi:hypothetical protein
MNSAIRISIEIPNDHLLKHMNLQQFIQQNETIRLVSLDSRYHGGYESPVGVSRIERVEIILFQNGSFTLTHGRNESNGPKPEKNSGYWEIEGTEPGFNYLVFKYDDGRLQKMNVGKFDSMFVFLDKRRFRVETMKLQQLGLSDLK